MSKRYLTEDEIDIKISDGGGGGCLLAYYRVIGTQAAVSYQLISGNGVITSMARIGVGSYGINHTIGDSKYALVPIGIITNSRTSCFGIVSNISGNSAQIKISSLNSFEDASFYLLIFR